MSSLLPGGGDLSAWVWSAQGTARQSNGRYPHSTLMLATTTAGHPRLGAFEVATRPLEAVVAEAFTIQLPKCLGPLAGVGFQKPAVACAVDLG